MATILLESVSEPRFGPEVEIGGVKTIQVSGLADAGDLRQALPSAREGHAITIRLWIGIDDSLPRRARIGGPLSDGEADNIVRQIDFSRFNSAVNIQPPE